MGGTAGRNGREKKKASLLTFQALQKNTCLWPSLRETIVVTW